MNDGMAHAVIQRTELLGATLDLGGHLIDLADYATTGLRVAAIGPSGSGKTNAGLLVAEQLVEQGWVAVLVDPEGELESLYGSPVSCPQRLQELLEARTTPVVVVSAPDAESFVPYGQVILDVADRLRKPLLLVVDEGQMFSSGRKRSASLGESTDLLNAFAERGRKRALDLFLTAPRYSASLNRSVFGATNLTLIGRQEDPTVWSALAPQFRGSSIGFSDLRSLAPGEFYCFSRRGIDRVAMRMARALAGVALAATPTQSLLPSTFSQWDAAVSALSTDRLEALSAPVVELLSRAAGLTRQQVMTGSRALEDELALRRGGA